MYSSSTFLKSNFRILLLGVTASFLLSGCPGARHAVQPYRSTPEAVAPSQPQQEIIQENEEFSHKEQVAYARQVLLPIRTTVRGRIAFYSQKMSSWQRLEHQNSLNRSPEQTEELISCSSRVLNLYETYNKLQVTLFNGQVETAEREQIIATLQHLQKKDFSYLEGKCPPLFKELSAPPQYITNILKKINPIKEIKSEIIPVERQAIFEQPVTDYRTNSALVETQYNQMMQRVEPNPFFTAVQPDHKKKYQEASALLQHGRAQEARGRFSDLLANVRHPGNDALQLKVLQKFAELEFALKNYIPAKRMYEELEQLNGSFKRQYLLALQSVDSHKEEVDAYASLLLGCLTSAPERDGFTVIQQAHAFMQNFPVSSLHSSAAELAEKSEKDAEQWFYNLLTKADQLSAMGKNQKALELLGQVPLDILPLDKQDLVQQKKNALGPSAAIMAWDVPSSSIINIEAASDRTNKAVVIKEGASVNIASPPYEQLEEIKHQQDIQVSYTVAQEQQRTASDEHTSVAASRKTWDKGINALLSTEYDKAIGIFSDLLNTSLGDKALKKIEEASQAAGQDARKKAANFFQRANSATNPDAKRKHLLSSKELLEDILLKYPLAGLDAKVKRNLSRVDKELASIK